MDERQKAKLNEIKRTINHGCKSAAKWSKDRFYDAKNYYHENKEFLLVVVPVAIGGFKMLQGNRKSSEEKDRRELYIWDNRTGQYYRLRRKLRVGEQLELERRRSEGEPVGRILASMRVI